MIARRPSLALGFGVAGSIAIAVLLWVTLWSPGPEEPALRQSPSSPGAERPSLLSSVDRGELSARLAVRVVRAGKPAPGSVAMVEGLSAADALTRSFPPAAAGRLDHDGEVEVPVTCGVWCWVKAESMGKLGFALVSPWQGRRQVTIELDTSSLHVLVLQSDLLTVAGGCDVRFGRRPRGASAEVETEGRVTTDEQGYARIAEPGSGLFVLMAPGAAPTSGYPAVQVVAVRPGQSVQQFVVLVMPAPRERLRVEVHAACKPHIRRKPKLFLERIDDGSGELFPLPGTITAGYHSLELDVPRGSYRVAVAPMGELVVAPADERITVDGPTGHVVRVTDNDLWTKVQLRGVGYADLPLRVSAWVAGATSPPDPNLVYFGAPRWGQPAVSVVSLPGPRRLVATARGQTFLSQEPVLIRGESVVVEMIPASHVTIRWETWGTVPGGCMCTTATSAGEFARPFRRQLAIDAGVPRPVWTAEFVVPRESVTFECLDVAGQVAWRRELEPASGEAMILIDTASG